MFNHSYELNSQDIPILEAMRWGAVYIIMPVLDGTRVIS